jgi:hypothetical protein
MELQRTITSIFLVPTIKVPKGALLVNGFINGYIKDSQREIQYEDAVYVLFRPSNLDKFREFLDSEYDRTKSIIEDYDYSNGFVVVVYQLDPLFKPDFELIKQGKYSKTSKEFQELFPKKMKTTNSQGLTVETFTTQYRIFNKTDDLVKYWEEELGVIFDKNQEIWHNFNLENEILDLNKIKEYV